jgi:hypothetical protein
MRLKNTKTVKNLLQKNYKEDFEYYLNNNFTVLAVDGGKGDYITAVTYAGQFSDMLTVIKLPLPITSKYIMVEIKIKSSNYKDGNVNTLFAEATNEPVIIKEISFIKTSWSGSDNKLLINEEKEISMSSHHVMSKIADNFLEEKNKGLI